jgi:RimJ/RimL family protein N-acetyltransferase
MTHPWTAPIPAAARALAQRFAALVPVIRTPRTVLRAPRIGDFDAWFGIMGSVRAVHIGISDAAQAWMDFGSNVANWLLRGHGLWTITNHDDDVLGFVMVDFEPGDAEHELGYFICEAAEGQGFVTEAAAAARDYALNVLRLPSLVSYVAPENLRSAGVAARLGAVKDSTLDGCDIWRHHPQEGV